MKNEINEFLETGLSRYNEAHNVYWQFREEIQKKLKTILENKEFLGRFNADYNSIFSKPWAKGLILSSRIDGFYDEKKYSIGIGIDWTNEDVNFPIPFVWLEDDKRSYVKIDNTKKWNNKIYNQNRHLGFFGSYTIDTLEDIFNKLLNEFTDYLDNVL